MAVNFFDKETSLVNSPVEHLSFKGKSVLALKSAVRTIPSSEKLTGIEVRLLPPFIIDNNTEPFLLFPGYAKLYCLIIVVSDVNNQLVGGIDLQGFPRIGDKEYLPVNKTIFYWQGDKNSVPPTQIHTMISVIKSRKGLREVGKIMTDLKSDADYKGITKSLAGFAKNATVAGAALDIVTQLASVVGKYLGNVEDKPIGTVINSYTALYGDFNTIGVVKKSYPTKKVNFDLELVVRDSSVAKPAAANNVRSIKAIPSPVEDDVLVEMTPII